MFKSIHILFFIFSIQFCFGQVTYEKQIVKTLSSKKYKGRGYVDNGAYKAAKYIAKEFKKNKLQPLSDSYFQGFETSVNTQPKKLKLTINDTLELVPGKDYLINPASPSLSGVFTTTLLNANDLLNNKDLFDKINSAKGHFLLIDTTRDEKRSTKDNDQINEVLNYLKQKPGLEISGLIVFSDKKLTWTGSTTQVERPSFTVNKIIATEKIKKIEINTESKYYNTYKTQNVIGYIQGYSKTDSTIVIGAHYDHLGMMGKKTMFPGANDNASGVAMLLTLAQFYGKIENQPKYSMLFIAFGAEEIGLLGSKYYTDNPLLPLSKIKFMLNFDLAGTGVDGIKVVNATVYQSQFNKLLAINNSKKLLSDVSSRGVACNSDHCLFHLHQVPCFYIYTLGGIKAYHDIYDSYKTLPMSEFSDYSTLIKLFINDL